MKHTFTINGNVYTAKEFDFNTVCDLEDMGVSMTEMQNKPISAARAYFALCIGGDKELAGREIEQHLINGGDLTDLVEAMSKEMTDSDFFQALMQRTTKKTPTKKTATKSE